MTTRSERNRKKKKKRSFWHVLRNIILLIILAVAAYAGYLYYKADHIASKSFEDYGREKSALRDEKVKPLKDNVSVLLIGVDESEKRADMGSYRSDTLILATINKDDHRISMLSIPRDSYVYIPERDVRTRINSAYAYGGTKATIDTVENLLDIPVDYYVKVNFESFIDVVDTLDGITVDVPYEFTEQNSKDKAEAIHLKSGKQKLNGEEALALARTRKKDNDIERGKRQQEIIKAIVQKAVTPGSVLKYDDLLDVVGNNMKTNISFNEMKSFIAFGLEEKPKFKTLTLEGSDDWSTGAYYYQLDETSLENTKSILKSELGL